MTDYIEEAILNASYGNSLKEILDMVMAAENAFDNYGKVSMLWGDKGKKAEEKFTASLVLSVHALVRVGKIKDPYDPVESMNALNTAMQMVQRAYPNWPRAYRYWDDFYNAFSADTTQQTKASVEQEKRGFVEIDGKWKRLQQARALAEQGDAIEQCNLGLMYYAGLHVTQDYQEALKWLHLSAAQGNPEAQANLGAMYHGGFGTVVDYVQAMMWYHIAKAGGTKSADQNLQHIESLSNPAHIAEAQRMAREWWAAHHPAN